MSDSAQQEVVVHRWVGGFSSISVLERVTCVATLAQHLLETACG